MSEPKDNGQKRKWVFTINNPISELDDPAEVFRPIADSIKYAIWQLETAPTTGTPHWQGFVEFKTRGRRLSGMKKLFPRARLAAAKGNAAQNKVYCSKEEGRLEGPYEIGEAPKGGAGSRSDLRGVKRMIDEGASEVEIADEYFGSWCRYHKSFKRYRALKESVRNWQTKVRVFYGSPGTGKSMLAMKMAEAEAKALSSSVFVLTDAVKHSTGVWWDGYNDQKVVVIEEFSGWLSRSQFKSLVNHCPLTVQEKGGTVPFRAHTIYITSNYKPVNWWKMDSVAKREAWPEIVRRLRPPIGQVDLCVRNPAIEAGEEFQEGFCELKGEAGGLDLVQPFEVYNTADVNV